MPQLPTVKIVLTNKTSLAIKVTVPHTTQYKYRNLDEKINPLQWDKKAGICKKGHKDCERINQLIFEERTQLIKEFQADWKNNIDFTASHINARLKRIYSDTTKDFYAFCREQIGIKKYSSETRRTHRSEVSKMEQYSPVLSFSDITYKWLQGYEHWMRTGTKERLPNHPNTIWKSLKFINTMLNAAIRIGGIIKDNPMKEYDRGNYRQGIPVYLEWKEVEQLHDVVKTKPMTEYLRLIGYYSLLSCYAGLRFFDCVNFNYSKKVIEDSNGKRLILYAAKNGEIVSIAFTKYINEIVEYIKDKPIKITNQEFNAGLKSLRAIAEITKDFSAHACRHGFAMRLAELGISIEDAQKLMGHNKRSSTEIYYRVKSARLDAAMQKWN